MHVERAQPLREAANDQRLLYGREKYARVGMNQCLEAREFATIQDRIHEAEKTLEARRDALGDPAIASDAVRLLDISAEIEEAQKIVDQLYARWAELEQKQS